MPDPSASSGRRLRVGMPPKYKFLYPEVNMKIAYLLNVRAGKESGVLKKVVEQGTIWQDQGHEVKLFVQSPDANLWSGLRTLPVEIYPPPTRWQRYFGCSLGVPEVLRWKPDLVYQRFTTYFPSYKHLMDSLPVVLEVNTDDLTEYRYQLRWRAFTYHRLTRGLTLKRAAGMVYVTRDLSQKCYFTSYGKPSIVLANGIDVSQYDPLPAPHNSQPHLAFIGTPGWPWHGVEKVVQLARLFPDWHFDIVGYHKNDIEENVTENVICHGLLNRESYQNLLAQTDVAIGTLAYYKIQMQEGCPLKLRQYLVYGLPTMIAYQDTDFPQGHPLILQIPNTPDNIETQQESMRQFVQRAQGKRIERDSIIRIDSTQKEIQRLEFFQQCLHTWNGKPI
jgi:glycosyltransferase involved in cell wall biosynthesis